MASTKIFDHLMDVTNFTPMVPVDQILKAADMMRQARVGHQRVWVIGNGGSAATAMHFAQDLQKICGVDACAVPAQVSGILAYGNDNGWERMYTDYLHRTFQNGDILVAISCSGHSPNIVHPAGEVIREHNGKLVVLTGPGVATNDLAKMAGVIIEVKATDITVVEDVHSIICHAIVRELARAM